MNAIARRAPRIARRAAAMCAVVLAGIGSLTGCSSAPPPRTLTIQNDARQPIDVRYAVLAPDGNPATPGEGGIVLISVPTGGIVTEPIADPTDALGATAGRSDVVAMRVLVTPGGAGPDMGQWLDMLPPPPFAIRATSAGAGVRVERLSQRELDTRQLESLQRDRPQQPGRSGGM